MAVGLDEPVPVPTDRSALTRFTAAAAVSSVGTGLFLSTGTVFFVSRVGLPAAGVGLALSAGAVLGLLVTPVAGRLADRAGVVPVLLAVIATRALGYGGLAFAGTLAGYTLLVVLAVAGDQATPSLQQALVGRLVAGPRRTELLGTLRAVRNVGLTVGFLLGGAALQWGSDRGLRFALGANGLSFLGLLVVIGTLPERVRSVRRTPPGERPGVAPTPPAASPPVPAALANRRFLAVTGGNALLLLHAPVLSVLLPLWVVTRTPLPAAAVPALLAVNTVLTVVLQLGLPRTRLGRSTRGLGWAAGLLVACCAAFGLAETAGSPAQGGPWATAILAGVGIIALTLGENLHAVAAWNLSYELAPPDRAAEYLSVFSLGTGLTSMLGPVLITSVLLPLRGTGWLLLAALFGAGVVTVLSQAGALRRAVVPAEVHG